MKTLWTLTLGAIVASLAGVVGAQELTSVDRIVAVVDEDPILESDLERVIGLGLAERGEEEDEEAFRRRVLDQVIEEKLRFHEIDRFGFSEIAPEDVNGAYEEIRTRFDGGAAFESSLAALGMTADELRQLVARQLMVLTYVDERLGPRVFVSSDEIEDYYQKVLVPELRAKREAVPELADVREEIRAVVKQQRLDDELRRWTLELRRDADVEDYLEEPLDVHSGGP